VIFQIPHLPRRTSQATKTCSICTLTARQDSVCGSCLDPCGSLQFLLQATNRTSLIYCPVGPSRRDLHRSTVPTSASMRLLFAWYNRCFMCPEFHQYDSNATMFEKREIREVERIYRVQSSEFATNLQSRSLLTIGILLGVDTPSALHCACKNGSTKSHFFTRACTFLLRASTSPSKHSIFLIAQSSSSRNLYCLSSLPLLHIQARTQNERGG
jgi:hypothetical protein